jgi:hypothetical protein
MMYNEDKHSELQSCNKIYMCVCVCVYIYIYINYVNVLLDGDKVKYWKCEMVVDGSMYQDGEQLCKWHSKPPGTKVKYSGEYVSI